MLRRLRHRVGRRGAFLLFLAVLDCVYCYGLLFPSEASRRSQGSVFLAGIAPLQVWAVLWGGVGLVCLIYAFKRKDAVGYACAMFLKCVWACVYLAGSLFGGLDRGYLSFVIWSSFAFILGLIATWPEAPDVETALEDFPDAIVTADPDGRITGWQGAAEKMFGWTEAEAVGQPLTILIPARHQTAHERAVERVRRTGESRLAGKALDAHGVRRDGSEFPVQILVGTYRAGDTAAFSAVIRDCSGAAS